MRRSIGLLVTSGLLPVIAIGGAFGVFALRAQRDAVRTEAASHAAFASMLVATRLEDGLRAVNMIAQSPGLDEGPLNTARFQALAGRLKIAQDDWRTLSIADPAGHRLVDVPRPIADQIGGPVVDMASLRECVMLRRPVIGNVLKGAHGFAFAVRAPVIRDGQVRYIVSAVIPAQTMAQMLRFRPLASGWRAALVDRAGDLVASSEPNSAGIGTRASRQGLISRRQGRANFYEFDRHDGTHSIGTWAMVDGTGWSVHVSAPARVYLTPNANAIALLVGVVLLCLALLAVLIRLLVSELRQSRARDVAEVQSQRMEALGRLTGGVAHDFNNLLTPILGGLDLLKPRLADDARATRYLDAAIASAERARALVARLLAFARRQPLEPQDVALGQLLHNLSDLLNRSVSPTARVSVDLPPDLPTVRADRAQLELAILNLSINARDAMPDGGVIRIAAAPLLVTVPGEVAPGQYVAISIVDTGTGMDAATLRQAIDPFFTTKPVEKGTGLGLSMVHGFAAQSGGVFRLASAPGAGTTATIVLPQGAAEAPAVAPPRAMIPRAGRIVLVDDDGAVRDSTAALLREGGYQVEEAASVAAALALIEAKGEVDAVVTDYLMPDRTGADLIRELRRRHPGLPVLLVTGFISVAEDVPGDVAKIQKPFRQQELLEKLATLLGQGVKP